MDTDVISWMGFVDVDEVGLDENTKIPTWVSNRLSSVAKKVEGNFTFK